MFFAVNVLTRESKNKKTKRKKTQQINNKRTKEQTIPSPPKKRIAVYATKQNKTKQNKAKQTKPNQTKPNQTKQIETSYQKKKKKSNQIKSKQNKTKQKQKQKPSVYNELDSCISLYPPPPPHPHSFFCHFHTGLLLTRLLRFCIGLLRHFTSSFVRVCLSGCTCLKFGTYRILRPPEIHSNTHTVKKRPSTTGRRFSHH